jgi:uncharacterized protein YerC
MTNISKKQLTKKQLAQLFEQLNTLIGKMNSSKANDFLHDLLGPEERIMLAKRLAIIVMITESYSSYRIAKILHVSTATVDTARKKYEGGSYDRLLSQFNTGQKQYVNLIETLDSILHLGGILPHYNGIVKIKI